ncbi:NAD(P)-binding protein [Aureobasidium subglaciale]|nr:NAD(P)-binding protein [Aureobasidium subglaciale]
MTTIELLTHPIALSIVAILVASAAMGLFSSNKHFPVEGRTVLITGGSSGMGRALAKKLAQRGANVCIVARNQSKLDETIEYIKVPTPRASPACISHARSPNQRFLAISADCTSAIENSRILDEVTSWNNAESPDIVWANAGSSSPGLFLDTPLETHRAQMDMNYWASFYLAHATLKRWLAPTAEKKVQRRPRHFIMTASTLAFIGVAGYTPYAPAKAALKSLADSLRMELNMYNATIDSPHPSPAAATHIHLVCPGTILSPGYENENKSKHAITKGLESGDPKQSEDSVADAALKGLQRGDYIITTQWLGHAMRVSALGGSPRNGWGIVDVLFSWATSVAWLFIAPDMETQVWRYGKEHGSA